MKTKKIVGWSITGVSVLVVIFVIILAANVGGEASKLKDLLDRDVSSHATVDDVKQQLSSMGYDLPVQPAPPEFSAKGPRHSALVYSTWLTLKVQTDQDGKMHGYNIDRASAWF